MPTLEIINVGQAPNDKKGDPLRNAMQKVVLNFTTLNEAIQGVLDGKGKPNGYASLGVNGRLLAEQAPIVYASALPTTAHDLNDYVTPGTLYQTTPAGATAGTNYPVLQEGFLEITSTGTPVMQVYTTRVTTPALLRRFWRTRTTATAWSAWKEVVDTTVTLSYAGLMASGQDLNTYTSRGIWFANAASIASSGSNYPVATAGWLTVLSASALGTPGPTTGVTQRYESVNGRIYTRYLVSTTWTTWEELVRTSTVGAASGIAQLGTNSRLLPAQAPILYSTVAANDANDMIVPGVYYVNSDASATPELNWPERLAGTLTVEMAIAGNAQITQTYTTRNGTGGVSRTYKRVRFGSGAGTWGLWQQLARFDDAMTHTFLTAAADVNTLVADNTFYTFSSAVVMTNGSNWPPTSNVIGGSVEVQVIDGGRVFQTVTLPVTNSKPRIFHRFGDPRAGGTWQPWKMIGAVGSTGWLPTADCGDVYVDGVGWYKWSAGAYIPAATSTLLPTAAHDLNTYVEPGEWYQGTGPSATLANNYPITDTGFLSVKQFGTATQQAYTTRGSTPRQFYRVKTSATAWSVWIEVASTNVAVTHTYLSTATDANSLIADNTFYTWVNAAVWDTNFPPYPAKVGGMIQTYWLSAANIVQVATLNAGGGGRAIVFQRQGNGSPVTWTAWRLMSPLTNTNQLPTADAGDAYVDSLGWHRWNGTAYAKVPVQATKYRSGLQTRLASVQTITVLSGACASASGNADLVLAADSTRTLQASGAFVHGTTGNALLAGARAPNAWYFVFLIRRDSDGSVVVAFDTTVNCANRPSTYSEYRRVGTFRTDSNSQIWAFTQVGNRFAFDTNVGVYVADTVIAGTTYQPVLGTPYGVAHTVHCMGFVSYGPGPTAPLVSMSRPTTGGGYSQATYVCLGNQYNNHVSYFDIPMIVTGGSPNARFFTTAVGYLTLSVTGYTDHFED